MGDGPLIGPTGAWHGDVARHHSWSRPLADWLVGYFRGDELVPIYDFGCGMGHYMAHLRAHGFHRVFGFEASPPEDAVDPAILRHDLTVPYEAPAPGNVLCLEVGEHVPAEHQETLLATLAGAVAQGRALVLSWAVRGQGGDGHVNCLDNVEVQALVAARGFELDAGATTSARDAADLEWFRGSLMVFRRVR